MLEKEKEKDKLLSRFLGWFSYCHIASSLNQASLANPGFCTPRHTSLCCEFRGSGIRFINWVGVADIFSS